MVILSWLTSTYTFSQTITEIEYFIDDDPGVGLATQWIPSFTPNSIVDLMQDIPEALGLSVGSHTLYARAKDSNGIWGFTEARPFIVKVNNSIVIPPPADIEKMEYFIDDDPGQGMGIDIPITQGGIVDVNTLISSINPIVLAEGFHTVGIRARNTDLVWGFYEVRQFIIKSNIGQAIPTVYDVEEIEYFFDDDPGVGLASKWPSFTQNSEVDIQDDLPEAASLSPGQHVLVTRAKNTNGDWGFYERRQIIVKQNVITTPSLSPITKIEYYIDDTDPGVGNGLDIPITPSTLIDLNTVDVATSGTLIDGQHTITVRAMNQDGVWSMSETSSFDVLDDCTQPTAAFTPQLACAGQPVTFIDNSTNLQPDATYRWYLDGDNTIDDTTVGNTSFTYANPGTYVVSLAIRQGTICLDSVSNVFTIKPLPAVVFSSTGTTTNQPTTFEASTVNLDPGATWSWDFDSDGTPESTNPNTAAHTYTADGSYTTTLIVSDGLGCEVTTTKSITVGSGGGTLVPQANFLANNGCVGSTITFTDLSRDLPVGATYSWDFDGDAVEDGSVEGSTSYVYSAEGSYSAKLTIDLGGSTIEQTQIIEIADIPVADFSAIEVCDGFAVDFTDISTSTSTSAVYMWDFDNDGIVDSNAKTDVSYAYSSAGNYIVSLTISNGFGCEDEVVKQVNVIQKPQPDFEWNAVCTGETILFNDLSKDKTASAVYSWDLDGDGLEDDDTNGDVSFIYATKGTYNASLTIDNLSGCSTTISIPIEIIDRPVVDLEIIARCYGQESAMVDLTLNANASANYQWDFNNDGLTDDTTVGSTSFTYSSYDTYIVNLTVDNGGNCVASAEALVDFADAAKPDFSVNKLCEGEEVVFTNLSADVNPAAIFSWDFNGDGSEDSAFPGSTANTYANAGTYNATLTIDNGGNCLAFKTIPLEVTPPPAVDLGPDEILCEAGTVILDAGTGYSTYSWPDGSGNQTYAIDQIGEYIVTVQDAKGCFNSDTIAVKLLGPPVPSFDYNVKLTLDGVTLELGNTSENYESISWDLDNGFETSDSAVSITYSEFSFFDVSTFTICITAVNNCDGAQYCEDIFVSPTQLLGSESKEIVIYPNPVQDVLTVLLNSQEAKAVLLNVQGKIVWKKTSFTDVMNIPMSGMLQGAYILLIEENNRFVYKRIIKE